MSGLGQSHRVFLGPSGEVGRGVVHLVVGAVVVGHQLEFSGQVLLPVVQHAQAEGDAVHGASSARCCRTG